MISSASFLRQYLIIVCFGLQVLVSSTLFPPAPDNTSGVFCTDRFGQIQYDAYLRRSCSMCFQYMFQKKGLYAPAPPNFEYLRLSPHQKNDSTNYPQEVAPDPRKTSSIDQVCQFMTKDECGRWKGCCNDAMTCCNRHLVTPEVSGGCQRTWDGYSCWDDTPRDTIVHAHCPFFLEHSIPTKYAKKTCNSNSTWFAREGMEWTDYTDCMNIDSHLTVVYISVTCSVVSLIILVPSTFIFIYYRELRKQQRVKLHIHFFIALALAALFSILWYSLVHYDLLMNTEKTQTVVHLNPVWCRLLSFGKIYFSSCTFSWMFCEGVYLHRLITKAFSPPKRLFLLYIIGWTVPALPVLIYATIRGVLANDSCWAKSYGYFEWIIYTPNLVCLIVNMVFLCNILRILLFQMHAHPHEPNNFRRGLKAAFMLVPLFGLQMLLTIYRPGDHMAGAHVYECITHIINNSQGVCVSLIFCVFNGEVAAQLRKTCTCCPGAKRRTRSGMSSGQLTQISTCGDDTKFSSMTPSRSTSGAGFNNSGGAHVQLIQPPEVRADGVEMNEYKAPTKNGIVTSNQTAHSNGNHTSRDKQSDGYVALKTP